MNHKPSPWNNLRVAITGASSGLGAALARELAKKGAKIALLARRADRLKILAGEIKGLGALSLVIPTDVRKDGRGALTLTAAASKMVKTWGGVDVVIANAGFGVTGNFDQLELEDFHRQFDTNLWGVVRTLKAFQGELEKTKGRAAIIGSVASYVSAPAVAPYSMSKYALRALAEALQGEWRPKGISVTHIAPGFIETEIHQVDSRGKWHDHAIDGAPPKLMMKAPLAAKQIVRAIWKRKPQQVITWHGKGIVLLTRFFPGLVRLLARGMAKPKA